MSVKWEKILHEARTWGTIITGLACGICCAIAIAFLLRIHIARGNELTELGLYLFGYVLLALFLVFLSCLSAYYLFSFNKTAKLPKAVRLSEAMQMLKTHTHNESLEAIRHYGIRIFSTKAELPYGISDDVSCKKVTIFLSFAFFRSDRVRALGSTHYCCDLTQIQSIITGNEVKWGGTGEKSGDILADRAALERKIADLQDKNKEATQKYTAAAGREGRMKKRLEETEGHIAVLVELASKVSNDIKPPRTITRDEIKAKYVAIGKIHGITEAPGTYVDIFRKNMPKEIINWSGAPKQGSGEEET